MQIRTLVQAALLLCLSAQATFAEPVEGTYRKKDIADARYGTGAKQKFLSSVSGIAQILNQRIFGQEITTQILEDKLIQYIESFPNNVGEPAALNLIGLPGVGKTGLIKALEAQGLPILFMNAQDYIDPSKDFGSDLAHRLAIRDDMKFEKGTYKNSEPLIIVIDELDKTPEIVPGEAEKTRPIIGVLNAILSEGSFTSRYGNYDLSNVLILTTMNFAPSEMEKFSKEALRESKSFYEFTIEDFTEYDQWVRKDPSARYKVLSNMFRTNTVSRLAPNTLILQPLSRETYRKIIEDVIKRSVHSATQPTTDESGESKNKFISVEYDNSLVEFLEREAVFAPAGARETVFRAAALVEQLINFGSKLTPESGEAHLDRPRKIHLAVENGKAIVTVTPTIRRNGKSSELASFSTKLAFDQGAKLFLAPQNLAHQKPSYRASAAENKPKPITKKEVRESRYPKLAKLPRGIEAEINAEVLGQQIATKTVLDDMRKYLARSGPAPREPSARTFAGFPGIGKSALIMLLAKKLEIPVVKINVQNFTSPTAGYDLLQELEERTTQYRLNGKKYFVLFEELDKAFEIDQMGMVVDRPVMGVIKDLLNEGKANASSAGNNVSIDLRDAFLFITMNFAVDRFGFTADPRLTGIEDVIAAWRRLSSTPMATKSILGAMFLPDTVSRLLSKLLIMKPLTKAEYQAIIAIQAQLVIDGRTLDKKGRNVGQMNIKLSQKYRDYLYSETVIPSEGARYTVMASQAKISTDLESALDQLGKRRELEAKPIEITLDYNPTKQEVVIRAKPVGEKAAKQVVLAKKQVALQFPSPEMKGKIPAGRLHTAAHEFGHAYVGALMGHRFEHVVVISPQPGVGGYVKFNDKTDAAASNIAFVYAALASRALERIVSSPDPESDLSVFEITAGASQDIKQATLQLFNSLYELGFDPNGETIDRNFIIGPGKYADFASIPPADAKKLGRLLREMENFIVSDLLKRNSQQWYVEKISTLATKGAMSEVEFYQLIGRPHPGNSSPTEVTDHFRNLFNNILRDEEVGTPLARKEMEARQVYMEAFLKNLKKVFHSQRKTKKACKDLLQKSA